MSHVVTIKTEIRDLVALRAACRRLQIPEPVHERVRLFSSEATGQAVRLPRWRYPVVCDVATGKVAFDNFGGRWGDQVEFDRLMQTYSAEKTKLEARKQGYTVSEQRLTDGSLKMTIHVGGTT
jgi:hypothetical protein